MKYKNRWFTFVELIVVITIMAILASIWFGVYQSYLSGWRDANRLVQLKDIHDWLERYSVNSRLPFPEDMIEVQANGNTFALQWYAWNGIIKAIGYDGGWRDNEYGTYFTYMLWESGRDFQLLAYIDDPELLTYDVVSNVSANQEYASRFPKVLGSPLWILLEHDTLIPIHEVEAVKQARKYDIITDTLSVKSYLYDTTSVDSTKNDITQIIPSWSCERIRELGKSRGSGEYFITPNWGTKLKVYCDMEIDGWWWMLVAKSVLWASWWDFGWKYTLWNIMDDSTPYSLGPKVQDIYFSEIMFSTYTEGKNIDAATAYTVDSLYLQQNLLTGWDTSSDVTPLWACRNIKTISWENTPCDQNSRQLKYWWRFWNNTKYVFNWRSDYNAWLPLNDYYWNGSQFQSFEWKPGMIFIR